MIPEISENDSQFNLNKFNTVDEVVHGLTSLEIRNSWKSRKVDFQTQEKLAKMREILPEFMRQLRPGIESIINFTPILVSSALETKENSPQEFEELNNWLEVNHLKGLSQKLKQEGLDYMLISIVEARRMFEHMSSEFGVKVGFEKDFQDVSTWSNNPVGSVRNWLERNVNNDEKQTLITHDNGSISKGLVGQTLTCPANGPIVHKFFTIFMVQRQLVAEIANS